MKRLSITFYKIKLKSSPEGLLFIILIEIFDALVDIAYLSVEELGVGIFH